MLQRDQQAILRSIVPILTPALRSATEGLISGDSGPREQRPFRVEGQSLLQLRVSGELGVDGLGGMNAREPTAYCSSAKMIVSGTTSFSGVTKSARGAPPAAADPPSNSIQWSVSSTSIGHAFPTLSLAVLAAEPHDFLELRIVGGHPEGLKPVHFTPEHP